MSSTTQPDPVGDAANNTIVAFSTSNKILILAAAALLGLVLFMFGMHLYVRCRWRARTYELDEIEEVETILERRRRRRARRNRRQRGEDFDEEDYEITVHHGLAKSVMEKLPTFVFKAEETVAADMQCAVCLEDFTEGEKGRQLPKCNHSFHAECIDMWLDSHSSCPLCRSEVAPPSIQIELPVCPRGNAHRYQPAATSSPSISAFPSFNDRTGPSPDSLPLAIRASVANALRSQNFVFSDSETDEEPYTPRARDSPTTIEIEMSPSAATSTATGHTSDGRAPVGSSAGFLRTRAPSPRPMGSQQRQESGSALYIVDYRPTVSTLYSTATLPHEGEMVAALARDGHRRKRSFLALEIIGDYRLSSSDSDSDGSSSSSHGSSSFSGAGSHH